MLLSDIVAYIPEDDLQSIRKEADQLKEAYPTNENGEQIDWFRVIAEDWWEAEHSMPNSWFRWWEEE